MRARDIHTCSRFIHKSRLAPELYQLGSYPKRGASAQYELLDFTSRALLRTHTYMASVEPNPSG